MVVLVERRDPVVAAALAKLGFDAEEVLRELSRRLVERHKTPRRKTQDKKEKKKHKIKYYWNIKEILRQQLVCFQ
jgi:hypothetical protein